MSKLGDIQINGKTVSVFRPPHDEPDFPWVDMDELARAFLAPEAAGNFVQRTQGFDQQNRPYVKAKNGDRIATIVCHVMAQGFCGAMDVAEGHTIEGDDETTGPAEAAYSLALGRFAAKHWPLPLNDLMHALQNPGGPFMRESAP